MNHTNFFAIALLFGPINLQMYSMDLKTRLISCKQCENRKFDSAVGIVCALTQRKPNFENTCKTFVVDEKEAQKMAAKQYVAQEENKSGNISIWGILGIAFIVIRILIRLAKD